MMEWNIADRTVARSVDELLKLVLESRDIVADQHAEFLKPKHPRDLKLAELSIDESQVAAAVQLLQQAKQEQQNILIFGDYDADGVCASALVWEVLHSVGFQVRPFLPNRKKHGYGLTVAALEEICSDPDKKPDVIITVDNGIVAHDALRYAADQGIKVIVTDHHKPDDRQPHAAAVVHTTKLCGATVAWILLRELAAHSDVRFDLDASLDLCALATIGDMVPLTGANRSFAYHGMHGIRKAQRQGLRALYAVSAVNPELISAGSLSFQIVPSINAAGRLGEAIEAVRVLCTKHAQKARERAQTLRDMNLHRQDVTKQALAEALEVAKEQSEELLIVAYVPDAHEGVVGLVAGRLVEILGKPAIVLTHSTTGSGDAVIKGSARSVAGVDITAILRSVSDKLLTVGGHKMAAGLSFAPDQKDAVITALRTTAKEVVQPEHLMQTLTIVGYVSPELITTKTVASLQQIAPFGIGNPRPVFCVTNVLVREVVHMGKEKNHVRLKCSADGFDFTVIFWRAGKRFVAEQLQGQTVEIAGVLDVNNWNGREYVQIIGKDIRTPEA